ncbi:3,4-dihydroxy-2-butanone-4-phosphate synthase [Salipaludibacillus sp. CF4.18]|uniref:3,4-dihydroxy-2-butanone-4-phosphate synthase n=1 Tax=Salipaludibacillus sp. CF4.18 TaxID=3373081 RepID=UPI003EE81D85
MSSIQTLSKQLQLGRLVIVTDDFNENVSYFVGDINTIEAEKINFMIKKGKGLIYACISEEKAKLLSLPIMGEGGENRKKFTVSVDHQTVTTGISVQERTDTIKALNNDQTQSYEFNRPGHVFPLIHTKYGLFNNRNIAEAASELVRFYRESYESNAYICEILNNQGDIANVDEIKQIALEERMEHITMSKLLSFKKPQVITSFKGLTKSIPYVNKTHAFPNTNVTMKSQDTCLQCGVYGIIVRTQNNTHQGIMHVNETDHDAAKKVYDICLLDSLNSLDYEQVEVEVKFYLRDLRVFASSSIDDLVVRYRYDYDHALRLFRIIEEKVR